MFNQIRQIDRWIDRLRKRQVNNGKTTQGTEATKPGWNKNKKTNDNKEKKQRKQI